jgi:hypothetical protein
VAAAAIDVVRALEVLTGGRIEPAERTVTPSSGFTGTNVDASCQYTV